MGRVISRIAALRLSSPHDAFSGTQCCQSRRRNELDVGHAERDERRQVLQLAGRVLRRGLAHAGAVPERILSVPPEALVDVSAAARQVSIELRHEGRDHAALGAELLEVGLRAHGTVGGGERRRMGQRELDGAVTQLRVHGDHRRPHLLHALHEGLEHGAERRQAHQAVGIPPTRDRRERPRRERRGVFVHVVDEDLVFECEARLETHLSGLVRSAPEHRARAFRRQGAVGVVDIEDGRHRVRPPGQAADGGGVRFSVNVGEAVLVGRER